jgi:KDO2-lipid IV(A) lauroyltransferase
MKKKRRKKGTFVKVLEYSAVYLIILILHIVPLKCITALSNSLGDLLFFLVSKRRNIALENLRNAYQGEKTEQEIRNIARQCCRSFFLTFLETIKLRVHSAKQDTLNSIMSRTEDLNNVFSKMKKIHDKSGGCIFVTPHIGNWELLPYVSSFAGVPLVIVVRPLDNNYLEKLIYASRAASGQVIIPKKNSLFVLRKTLQQGKSIGMLPDQSTMKGLSVNFFGRTATTTPVPAILAITYKRPIVVTACCRKPGTYHYEVFVCDPILPEEYKSKKDEIFRLTEAINRDMESIIRKYPEQYLWIHNRWKTYKGKKEFLQ